MRELSEDNDGNLGDGNPYASPGTEQAVTEKVPDPTRSRSSGCLLFLLLALPLLDAYGLLLSSAGPYGPLVLILGPVGFACGALPGGYLATRFTQQPWRSSSYWAVSGLIGMCLLPFIVVHFLLARLLPP